MASSLRSPDPFNFLAGDLASEWATWRRQFEWYIKATRSTEEDEEVLIGVLITLLGSEGLKIYDTFVFTVAGDEKKLRPVLQEFSNYFQPRKSEVYERSKFLRRRQKPGESCETWLIELKTLIKSCGYKDQEESILRDQLVMGVNDPTVYEKLLYEEKLTLKSAIDIIRACELSKSRLDEMRGTEVPAANVHRLTTSSARGSGARGAAPPPELKQCTNCSRRHPRDKCWAADKSCNTCGNIGHLAKCCRSSQAKKKQSSGSVNALSGDSSSSNHDSQQRGEQVETITAGMSADYFVIHQLSAESSSSEWYEELDLEGVKVNTKLDSGATCNVLPAGMLSRFPPERRRLRPGPRVRSYGASQRWLKVLGLWTCKLRHRGKIWVVDFVIVDEPGQPAILGLPWCERLDLIRRVHTVKEEASELPEVVVQYRDVFQGLGRLATEHDIKLKPGADPVVHAARRIPFRLRDQVEKQLNEMEVAGIIERVTEPTEWVSPMVVASKPNGDVRICIDPTDLNRAIQRQHFAVPSVEELFGRISKARFYATLDATSGFYQIPLTENSSYLCTMATPFGRFRFLRLPFGIRSAPEVYQCTMQELFGDLDGIEIYMDDFLVWGETESQLNDRLEAVFARGRKCNLKLNSKKCNFFLQEVPWLGHLIGNGELKADPAKVKAILEMPEPRDKTELTRLLGMVTYLDKFCEGLSTLARPLRDLLKADSVWVWDEQQRAALDKLKEAFTSLPVLKLYDPAQPLVVSVDASPTGLGAVLFQAGYPVSYSSVTLTETQKRYVQIEKELLAVQFGLQRFRQYIYGQTVVVESDHKPLVGLLEKPIASCSPRIQRMRLQLQRHDFSLMYKPGRELYIADTLSRAHQTELYHSDPSESSEEQVHSMVESVIPEEVTRDRYSAATASDSTLRLVKELIEKGWPDHKRHCPLPAKPFWSVRHDLTTYGDLILRGEAIVIPISLQPEVLKRIHDGHFGEIKCINRAKSAVYWPNYIEQIRNLVASCSSCQLNRHRNPAQPLHPIDPPDYPFQKVGADLFEFRGVNHLLVVDYYSKWPSVIPLRSLTASAVIREMERIYADFGVPAQLVSDNGPQFGCAEFRQFCREKGVRLTTSSPEYPQSNGMAERTVQTVKDRMIKLLQEGGDVWTAVTSIRSTPVDADLPSPSVLLQGRNLRGPLPFSMTALQPRLFSSEVVKKQLQQRQSSSAFHQARLPDARGSSLSVGQPVRVLIKSKWIEGIVSRVCQEPNSYAVRTVDGREFRRNRRAINLIRPVSNPVLVSDSSAPKGDNIHPQPSRPQPPPTPTAGAQPESIQPSSTERATSQQQTPTPIQVQQQPVPSDSSSPFHGFDRPPWEPGETRSGRGFRAPPRLLFPSKD